MKIVTFVLSLAACAALTNPTQGQLVYPSTTLVEVGVETLNLDNFGSPGPVVDVYHLELFNENDQPVTALELDLRRPFINPTSAGATFRGNAALPQVFGQPIADSFFVVPEGRESDVLAVDVIDIDGQLAAAFTVSGGPELVPAYGSSVIATLSVPTGTNPDFGLFACGIGRAAVGGFFVPVSGLCPEPTSAMLFATGVLAAGISRKRPAAG